MVEKTCIDCGETFTPKYHWQKSCFDCYKRLNPKSYTRIKNYYRSRLKSALNGRHNWKIPTWETHKESLTGNGLNKPIPYMEKNLIKNRVIRVKEPLSSRKFPRIVCSDEVLA